MYQAPFRINSLILKLSQDISHELGVLSGAKLCPVPIELKRKNRIKTIQSSLAIEGNTLDIEQITSIIDSKQIIAPKKDIVEVQNAIIVYDKLSLWNPMFIQDLQEAHRLLMKNLIVSNGRWRTTGVAIFKKQEISHMAPPSKRVPILIENLFNFLKHDQNASWLLKACIFHYELEFIHPFIDGNGRIGRLWQQLLLMKENPIFEFISVESIIKQNQKEYYNALGECDQQGESTIFIEFSLKQILTTLKQYTASISSQATNPQQRLEYAKNHINTWFARKDYILLHKDISSATASRDLAMGLEKNILLKIGSNNQVQYKFQKTD
jgi:Fic family protein